MTSSASSPNFAARSAKYVVRIWVPVPYLRSVGFMHVAKDVAAVALGGHAAGSYTTEAVPEDASGAAEEPIHPEAVPEDATGAAEYFGRLVLD
jgi:hypothetical protein